ncbi:hypothetical protein J6590_106844, partial [Homalodisca vitripennis]
MSAGETFIPPFVIFQRKNTEDALADGAPKDQNCMYSQEELSDNFKVADSWEWPAYVQQCLNQLSESAGFTSAG